MKRRIVEIDREKCNGCGLCITACHEGAIALIDGKAQLISDQYCDGLGDCLPTCPTDAIKIVEREAAEFSIEAVEELKKTKQQAKPAMPCGCPGTKAKRLEKPVAPKPALVAGPEASDSTSELRQWPVQLRLINTAADYLDGANLLVAADCVAYAYANFHRDFIKDHITVIGCPKLDDTQYYQDKLAEILTRNNIKSVTVVRMEVPCCGGIVSAVKGAMLQAQIIIPYREVTISIDGSVL